MSKRGSGRVGATSGVNHALLSLRLVFHGSGCLSTFFRTATPIWASYATRFSNSAAYKSHCSQFVRYFVAMVTL